MRFFKLILFLIFALLLAACSVTEAEIEYIIVTATPEIPTATPFPTHTPRPTSTIRPTSVTQVVMAIQRIPTGILIQAHMIAEITFPAEFAPTGAYTNVEDVIGAYARNDIFREEIILAGKLVSDPDGRIIHDLVMTVFASRDIEAGESIESGMYYFAYVEQFTFEELGINFEDIYVAMGGLAIIGNEALTDIHAYEPIHKSMVGQ